MQASELLQRLKSNSAPLIVDARKTRLFKESHIPGAIHAKVPWILLGKVRFPEDRTTEMVITCEHGPRSWWPGNFWPSEAITILHSSKGTCWVGKRPACLWKNRLVTKDGEQELKRPMQPGTEYE